MIDTHHELVLALAEAAEIEHSLICQYLFAAYSLKTDPAADGITNAEAVLFRRWQEQIVNIARQEMGHLGTVWNIAALVGAAPHTGRVNFPQQATGYYPPAIGFALEPFGDVALRRFIEFEKPMPDEEEALMFDAPEPLDYTRVGDLYRQIRDCIDTLPESELLVNPSGVQDSASWSNSVTLKTATTRGEARNAIDFIIEQGEGAGGVTAGSHFGIFETIAAELQQHLANGGAVPARACVANPATQKHRDAPSAVIIDAALTVRAVDLFNLLYGMLLHMLRQFYAFGAETEDQRLLLREAAYQLMRRCLRPLGSSLTRMPAFASGAAGTAGPSFEIYGFEAFSPHPQIAWSLLVKRLRAAQQGAAALATDLPAFAALFTNLADDIGSAAEFMEEGLP